MQLVWFQHMHKVAGTTIVQMAANNGLRMYPSHLNGNPAFTQHEMDTGVKNGKSITSFRPNSIEIPIYNYGKQQLNEFIDDAINRGVEFIGCEWQFPSEIAYRSDVFYMTCIRNPWERFMSNYNYDHGELPNLYPSLEDWMYKCQDKFYARDNYYTSILAGLDESYNGPITKEHYAKAITNLKQFNLVTILEDPDMFHKIEFATGWSYVPMRRNQNTVKNYPSNKWKTDFMERNQFDMNLYSFAKTLSKQPKITDIEWSFQQQFYGKNQIDKWRHAITLASILDKTDNKELAISVYLFVLKKTPKGLMKLLDNNLTNIIQPYNQLEMNKPLYSIDELFNIFHQMSYICYYTTRKDIGKMCCQFLIDTNIDHKYKENARDIIKYYQ